MAVWSTIKILSKYKNNIDFVDGERLLFIISEVLSSVSGEIAEESGASYEKISIDRPMHIFVAETDQKIEVGLSSEYATIRNLEFLPIPKNLYNNNDERERIFRPTKSFFGVHVEYYLSLDKNLFSINSDIIDLVDKTNEIRNNVEEQLENLLKNISNDEKSAFYYFIDEILKSTKDLANQVRRKMNMVQLDPVFKARGLSVNDKNVFCALEFNDARKGIQKVIKSHLEDKFDLTVTKSGDIFNPNEDNIMENIWISIVTSKIVIVDISEKNPNVFYELGICHTVGKKVILICDEAMKSEERAIPFDIESRNIIFYKNDISGTEGLLKDISTAVEGIIKNKPMIRPF